jgi:hypothetical protein
LLWVLSMEKAKEIPSLPPSSLEHTKGNTSSPLLELERGSPKISFQNLQTSLVRL